MLLSQDGRFFIFFLFTLFPFSIFLLKVYFFSDEDSVNINPNFFSYYLKLTISLILFIYYLVFRAIVSMVSYPEYFGGV